MLLPDDTVIALGRIRITEDVPLRTGFVAFTEYFGPLDSCNDLPHARTISELTVGQELVPAGAVQAYGPCASNATGEARGAEAMHEIGSDSRDPR